MQTQPSRVEAPLKFKRLHAANHQRPGTTCPRVAKQLRGSNTTPTLCGLPEGPAQNTLTHPTGDAEHQWCKRCLAGWEQYQDLHPADPEEVQRGARN